MDASTFSLTTALQEVSSYMEVLSFKRLSDYISNANSNDQIGDTKIKLTIWTSTVSIPATLFLDDFVFAVPVSCYFIGRHGSPIAKAGDRNEKVKGVEKCQLLLKRGTESIGAFFQITTYRPAGKGIKTMFDSELCRIFPISSDRVFNKVAYPPVNFGEHFWTTINEWAAESISARNKMNKSLADLQTKCAMLRAELQARKLIKNSEKLREQFASRG